MARIRIKGGTRAQLTAAGALLSGEPFFVTDESNVAVGTGPATGAAAGEEIILTPHTRATLDAAKAAGTLHMRELYHITDESRIAIGTSASSYIALLKEGEGGITGVAAPTNLLPKPNALGLTAVRLVGSIYYSTEGKTHQASKFQISTSAGFGTLAFEATKGAVTTLRVKATDVASNSSYYWRVSYQDASGAWGAWSVPTAFAVGTMVDIPDGSGGTVTYDGDYTVHTFTAGGYFSIPTGRIADVLVVAGGGGGGAYGGGGGGGGVIYKTAQSLAAGSYAVTVGAGGAGSAASGTAANGSDSQFDAIATAAGGGGGGSFQGGLPKTGGSGGGGSNNATQPGGAGTAGQGYAGGSCISSATGGGGGGGAAGNAGTSSQAGHGGIGFACSISPAATHYAGGGGGGARNQYGTAFGGGGSGGGGDGMHYSGTPAAVAGATNTGGGGGGGAFNGTVSLPGASGGSGIVIVRYLT